MRAPLPFVWTRGLRVAYNRFAEMAKGDGDFSIVYGASGAGKTEIMEKFAREWAWPGPVGDYVGAILGETWQPNMDFAAAVDLSEKTGLIAEGNRDEFLRLLAGRFKADGARDVSGATLWNWLCWVTGRLGEPAPRPVAYLWLWRIKGQPPGRYPIMITAMGQDRERDLEIKVLQAMERAKEFERPTLGRRYHLQYILERMPLFVLVDEADMLRVDALHSIRQLCDVTRTPLVLAGTHLLQSRLQTDPRLRPLATRIGLSIRLAEVTLADLQDALPQLDSRVLKALWLAGGRQFRTISLILRALDRFQEANPGRRVTCKAVASAAERVLAARPPDVHDEQGEEAAAEEVAARSSRAARARVAGEASADLPEVAQAAG